MFSYLSITIVCVIGMFLYLPKTRIPTNLPPNYRLTVIPIFFKGGVDGTEKNNSVCNEEVSSTFTKAFLYRMFTDHDNFTIVVYLTLEAAVDERIVY